jgi:response regulator NasT
VPAALQSALELALRRFDDLQQLTADAEGLRGALERRVVLEQAKGILMERHRLSEDDAYHLLRAYSRDHRQQLLETARQILGAHRLLCARPDRAQGRAAQDPESR